MTQQCSTTAEQVTIRWMVRAHLPEVQQIEQHSFPQPWTRSDFLRVLRQRDCVLLVALDERDAVLGYVAYRLHRRRLEILSLAVAPAARRRGVARTLVRTLIGKLCLRRRACLAATVREGNLPAQMFFRAMGFRAMSVARGYYADFGGEDAYRFRYLATPFIPVERID